MSWTQKIPESGLDLHELAGVCFGIEVNTRFLNGGFWRSFILVVVAIYRDLLGVGKVSTPTFQIHIHTEILGKIEPKAPLSSLACCN